MGRRGPYIKGIQTFSSIFDPGSSMFTMGVITFSIQLTLLFKRSDLPSSKRWAYLFGLRIQELYLLTFDFLNHCPQIGSGSINALVEISGSNPSVATLSSVDGNSGQYVYNQNSPVVGNQTTGNALDYQHQSYLPSLPAATTSSATKTGVTTTTEIFSGGMESWLSYI